MERDRSPNLKKWIAEVETTILKAAAWPSPLTGADGMACVKQITAADGAGGVTIMIVSGGDEQTRRWMEKALLGNGGVSDNLPQKIPLPKVIQ